jgi:hypothetical protein
MLDCLLLLAGEGSMLDCLLLLGFEGSMLKSLWYWEVKINLDFLLLLGGEI